MSYKMSRVVITAGVSAFAKTNQYRAWCEAQAYFDFPSPGPNPSPRAEEDKNAALDRFAGDLRGHELPQVADPERVSAEYSGLHALRLAERLVDRPQVVLIHTDTLGGSAAARLVGRLVERDFSARVELAEISLDVSDRERMRYGLGDFMQQVATALMRGWDTSTTCFMPLGGYKVMTSLGYLAGAYFGFPTLYTHEDNQVLHEIPAVPVRVSTDELGRLAPLMKKAAGTVSVQDLTGDEVSALREASWLFEQVDGLVSVNAFGLFLMQEPEYSSLFAPAIRVSEQVSEAMGEGGRGPFIRQQLCSLAAKLAAKSTEQDLQHEKQWGLKSDRGQHLYKGASNGRLAFRCLYRFDEAGLHAEHVWTNHDQYEEEAEREWARALPCLFDLDAEGR